MFQKRRISEKDREILVGGSGGRHEGTKPAFKNDIPLAFVTWAFEVQGWYPQHKFYRRTGFEKVKEDDPSLPCYLLKKGRVYRPKYKKLIPQDEDRGKALIFYDSSCPFCLYFSAKNEGADSGSCPEYFDRNDKQV